MYKDALNCRTIFKMSVNYRGLILRTVAEFKFVKCSSGGMFTAELYVSVYISISWS